MPLPPQTRPLSWSPVPQTEPDATHYIETALAWKAAGTAVPFAILREQDGAVIGSTRFWNIERWAWPQDHPQSGRREVDACEIGYTWFARSAVRTAANTEAKFLMFAHAFETWQVLRVCLHTDVRNTRSRAAIERIGGQFEGVLRVPPPGRGLHSSRLGAFLDRRGRVASSKRTTPATPPSGLNYCRLQRQLPFRWAHLLPDRFQLSRNLRRVRCRPRANAYQ